MLRGLRGATTVPGDEQEAILARTEELLQELACRNKLQPVQIVSVVFTATPDLRAEFPAAAARRIGWQDVPLLDAVEIDKPGALPRCVRVLILAQMDLETRPVHVYLHEAACLRPDLLAENGD